MEKGSKESAAIAFTYLLSLFDPSCDILISDARGHDEVDENTRARFDVAKKEEE